MEKKYRIPEASEFIQGFKFEVRTQYRFVVTDLQEESNKIDRRYLESVEYWDEHEVWWKGDPNELITVEEDGIKYVYTRALIQWFEPFNVEEYIKNGNIRVEIK